MTAKKNSGLSRRRLVGGALGAPIVGGLAGAVGRAPAVIAAQDVTEIRLARYAINEQWHETLLEVIAAFEEAHPNIKVNVEFRPGEQYWDKLQTEFASGTAPDISAINSPWVIPGASRGMFVDLNPLFQRDNVDRSDRWYDMNEWRWKGGLYGGLLYTGGQMLYVNKDLLAAANVEMPAADWNWDDLLAAAQRLTIADQNQFGIHFDALPHRTGPARSSTVPVARSSTRPWTNARSTRQRHEPDCNGSSISFSRTRSCRRQARRRGRPTRS